MIRDRAAGARRWRRAAVLAAALCTVPSASTAQAGYLDGRALHYTPVGVPADPAATELELTIVHAAQVAAGEPRTEEAIGDAKAYDADALMGRFADASLVPLAPATRPMLAQLLRQALGEVGRYSERYKKVAERPRPYVEDVTIRLCYDNPAHPLDPRRSYPSGHAANGYTAALILADLFPGRRGPILARGIRYGENRVVCGAHHPSDVLEGQLLAIEYVREAALDGRFRHDLACARAEDAAIAGTGPALPRDCRAANR